MALNNDRLVCQSVPLFSPLLHAGLQSWGGGPGGGGEIKRSSLFPLFSSTNFSGPPSGKERALIVQKRKNRKSKKSFLSSEETISLSPTHSFLCFLLPPGLETKKGVMHFIGDCYNFYLYIYNLYIYIYVDGGRPPFHTEAPLTYCSINHSCSFLVLPQKINLFQSPLLRGTLL